MAKKKPSANPFTGSWRITWMAEWNQKFINAEQQGYFDFDGKVNGEFHFGYVHGLMDGRISTREGKPCVEFTWEGNDEMDPALGRGWAVIDGDEIEGMLFFHAGDESAFKAKKRNTR
jgi:hypothetical protein